MCIIRCRLLICIAKCTYLYICIDCGTCSVHLPFIRSKLTKYFCPNVKSIFTNNRQDTIVVFLLILLIFDFYYNKWPKWCKGPTDPLPNIWATKFRQITSVLSIKSKWPNDSLKIVWPKFKTEDLISLTKYPTVCSPIKAKFRSRAFTCGNIRFFTLPYYYSFVWRFLKCMNGCCSLKDKKVLRFLIFRKIGFFNFAILKSSPNSETGTLIKKWL